MSSSATRIGIAIVEQRGTYLVGFRGEEGPLPGYAEFPGGKCEPGEATDVCAMRECLEETGLRVAAVRLLLNRRFTYEHGTVDLNFWLCRAENSESVAEDHRGYRWVPTNELGQLQFPEANEPLIRQLVEE